MGPTQTQTGFNGQHNIGKWIWAAIVGFIIVLGGLLFWYFSSRPTTTPTPQPGGNQTTQPSTQKPSEPLHVSIKSPSPGQTVSGTIPFEVTVDNPSRVARAEYYADGLLIGITYAAPFSINFDTTKLTDGEHTILAKVYDRNGTSFDSQSITITVQQPQASQTTQTSGIARNSSGNQSGSGSNNNSSGGGGGDTGGESGGGDGGDDGGGGDATAPSVPSSLMVTANDGYTTNLSWSASTDNVGVSGYNVYRDGALLGSVLGASTTSYTDQTVVPGNTYEYSVKAKDAANNLSAASNEPSATLEPTSIWIDADSPQFVDTDSAPIELGVKFRPLVNGKVSGVRFYKGTGNTGTHTGRLWTSSGTSLATVTFTGETATGWQEATFTTPVDVTAGTTYVVSYTAPNGHISYTPAYFASEGITSQYLTAMASGVDGNNGVFNDVSPGSFPSTPFNNTNYWVDALFIPNPSAGGPTAKTLDTTTVHTGFPGSNNTGVPVGKRLPQRDREVIAYADGAIMENIQVNNEVHIRAPNVTIRKSKINGIIYLDTDAPGSGSWHGTVEDTEINAGTAQRAAISLGNFTVVRANIYGGQTGILCGNDCDVSDSWMHDQYLPPDEDWHLGGFLSNGGGNMTLTHNTITCSTLNNSAGGGCSGDLNLYGDFSAIHDVTIDGNLLTANADAGYCLASGYTDGKPFGEDAFNITVINNIFERGTSGQCGSFGSNTSFLIGGSPAPGSTWSNNKYDDGTVVNPE